MQIKTNQKIWKQRSTKNPENIIKLSESINGGKRKIEGWNNPTKPYKLTNKRRQIKIQKI